jgi:hypothetical protein
VTKLFLTCWMVAQLTVLAVSLGCNPRVGSAAKIPAACVLLSFGAFNQIAPPAAKDL